VCDESCASPDLDCPLSGLYKEPCDTDVDCESGLCREAPDLAGVRYCTLPCTDNVRSLVCGVDSTCVSIPEVSATESVCEPAGPTPRPTGYTCADDQQCASGICHEDEGICVVTCSGSGSCDLEQSCVDYKAVKVCLDSDLVPSNGGCGCRASGKGGVSSAFALLLALALIRRRRATFSRR
jgi:MYXO-CTERM domain-containing protein